LYGRFVKLGARLSASAPSSHDLSLAAFTINIAESNCWGTPNCPTSGLEADHPGVGLFGRRMKIIHPPQLGPLIE
jgi:hypothetical protein